MDTSSFIKIVQYRCACGNTIGLCDMSYRKCLQCSRDIPSNAFLEGEEILVGSERQPETADTAADPYLHQRVRHFKILEKISQGTTGSVYRAVDEAMQRDVALKILPNHAGQREHEFMQRILEEGRIQSRVAHPNIEQVYYVENGEEFSFVASEYVAGQSLKTLIAGRALPFAQILHTAREIILALQAAAGLHLLHRDLQPSHVLIRHDGCIKVVDFGQSRSMDVLSNHPIDQNRSVSYLAPEVCCGAQASIQSDLYSLGVMLFEMSFGRLPYADQSEHVLIKLISHQESRIDFPEEWPQHLPAGWKTLLEKLLCKQPQGRYANYDDLLKDVHSFAPANLRSASRTKRGLAWFIDLSFAFILMKCLSESLSVVENWVWGHQTTLFFPSPNVMLLAGLVATGVGALWQATYRTTPGKKFLALRIVNERGFQPTPITAFYRTFFQLAPIVVLAFYLSAPTRNIALEVLLGFIVCFTFSEILEGFLRADQRTPHDRFTNTRVVQVQPDWKPDLRHQDGHFMTLEALTEIENIESGLNEREEKDRLQQSGKWLSMNILTEVEHGEYQESVRR